MCQMAKKKGGWTLLVHMWQLSCVAALSMGLNLDSILDFTLCSMCLNSHEQRDTAFIHSCMALDSCGKF